MFWAYRVVFFFQNEITQVFENGVVESSSNSVEDDDGKNEKIDYELDPFLLQFNATIKSDLSELLSRYRQRQNGNGVSYAGVNNKVNNEDCFKWSIENLPLLTKENNFYNHDGCERKHFVCKDRLFGGASFESLLGSVSF
jgi:hypothetical protein